ncbi:hypothetical protein EXIGLDRAFT_728405 [Exidia glandulosa HHB12029]|uniref:Casein kinase substrate phosphoprotein PP28 domain-containing protein n=1 Tax=Exidia glandulosa HHB12029 TaxID=1314781 RepID=A0A165CXX8_EXIGL|nr:hypothetical protein EXIGLDRAFT_728405 [Exidia glandulosa HHB12029]
MVRGAGKFKTRRGGGRSFSKDMHLDSEGTAVGTDSRARRPRGENIAEGDEDDSDESEEEESEEESEEEAPADGAAAGSSAAPQAELTRAERRALKKKQGPKKTGADGEEEEDDDSDLINPNHVAKKLTISDIGAPRELSRREREQKEKQEAKERYMKLHLAGKTDQAKADMARLAQIRKEREEALAKRKAEAEAKAADLEAKKAASKQRR